MADYQSNNPSTSLVSSNNSVDFPRIKGFFDGAIYLTERLGDLLEAFGRLLFKSKLLIIGLALVTLTIIELYLFIIFLLSRLH